MQSKNVESIRFEAIGDIAKKQEEEWRDSFLKDLSKFYPRIFEFTCIRGKFPGLKVKR